MSDSDGIGGAESPVFPIPNEGARRAGIRLRDYMAIHAPSDLPDAMVGDSVQDAAKFLGIPESQYRPLEYWSKLDAKCRYMWAEAMLAESQRIEVKP